MLRRAGPGLHAAGGAHADALAPAGHELRAAAGDAVLGGVAEGAVRAGAGVVPGVGLRPVAEVREG